MIQVIVDETAKGSLALVQELANLGETANLGDGIYTVDARENKVFNVTDKFPEAIIKVEVL